MDIQDVCRVFADIYTYLYVVIDEIPNIIAAGDITFTNFQVSANSMTSVLTCTTTGGPATTVTWEKLNESGDAEAVETDNQVTVLLDGNTATYNHILTLNEQVGGVYGCSVSNNKPSSTKVLFTVTGRC